MKLKYFFILTGNPSATTNVTKGDAVPALLRQVKRAGYEIEGPPILTLAKTPLWLLRRVHSWFPLQAIAEACGGDVESRP